MKKMFFLTVLALFTALCNVMGQNSPKFILNKYADLGIVTQISDNGKWAIIKGATTEQQRNGVARILNIETGEETVIKAKGETDSEAIGKYVVNDITDDGKIVVGGVGSTTDDGTFTGLPAYYNVETQEWKTVKLPLNTVGASISAVTPDGKYAVGFGEDNVMDVYNSNSHGIMWNLSTGSTRNLLGLPTMPQDYSVYQERYTDISADGRYIAIFGNQSIRPTGFIYDTTTKSYIQFGKDGTNAPKDYVMLESDIKLSPNGKYAVASVRNNNDDIYACVYNTETKTYQNNNGVDEVDYMAGYVDNNGNVYASTPSGTPVREWAVLSEGTWYPFSLIMKQRYGRDFSKTTNYDNTGTIWAGSADGKVLGSMVSPQGEGYILVLPETITEACQGIDLLQTYTASPEEGSSFSWLSTVTLTFSQRIKVLGGSSSAILKDASGQTVRNSLGCKVMETDDHSLIVTFRETTLNAGQEYTVEIPAGTLCLASDERKTNKAVEVKYIGREAKPVYVTKAFPEDGTELAMIDNSSIFVVLDFDTYVKTTETASARLVEITEDGEKTVANLFVATKGTQVAIFPAAVQYLYLGAKYKVILDAGSVTDMVGAKKSANEEIVLNYIGSYERTVSTDSSILFSEDFNNFSSAVANMLRYEGDHNTPSAAMQDLGFDADNEPWNFTIRDNEASTDYCASSTSMYDPAGQSDDWMVTPQLIIPDEFCSLTFDAQKYKDLKDDKINVVIWECDENINYLTSAIVEKMKAEGKVTTFNLSIGETEEGLEGEYEKFAVDLKDYSGKKIYIGFWNNNKNQSIVFIDNILVQRSMKYLLSLTTPTNVVKKENMNIEGMMLINSQTDTYSSLTMTLKDKDGNAIDTYSKTGTMKYMDIITFQFAKAMPLEVGEVNNFSIDIQLDSYLSTVKGSIKDLSFEPTKRVVLEEVTGTTCPNCPKGILAIERLKETYKDKFIPVSLHTYDGDPYTSSTLEEYCITMGLTAAPQGMVQRNGIASSPMGDDGNGKFTFSNGYDLWQDFVDYEMSVPTYIDLSIPSASRDEVTGQMSIVLRATSAINIKNQYINVFPVVLEDGFVNSQVSNVYLTADPALGEWGKGGKYAYPNVPGIVHDDVARDYWGAVLGSSVGFPQKFENGKSYDATLTLSYPESIIEEKNSKIVFMAVDATTRAIINAIVLPMTEISTGIDNVIADNGSTVEIVENNGIITAKTNGTVTVEVYTVGGSLLGKSTGFGGTSVATAYKGAVVVKAMTDGKTVTEKIVM